MYKGKGEHFKCANLLSLVGKVYGGILIDRIRSSADRVIGEEQCGLREGRGCIDQIFAVRQLCKKYSGVNKDVHRASLVLEKAYDEIDRNALWRVLSIYGVGSNLLRAVQDVLNLRQHRHTPIRFTRRFYNTCGVFQSSGK